MKKTMIMAKIIKTDGTIVEVTPQNGTDFQLYKNDYICGDVLICNDGEVR